MATVESCTDVKEYLVPKSSLIFVKVAIKKALQGCSIIL